MGRNYVYGTEISALHASTDFTLRKPIKYSNLNITQNYSASQCCEDIERILTSAINEKMGLATEKFKFFNSVIVIPDTFVRHHVRHILNIIFAKMGFKSAFVHVESVMSSYAMAA